MLMHLARVSPMIDSSSRIELTEYRTCVDTFIPGREGADCAFLRIQAKVALRQVR